MEEGDVEDGIAALFGAERGGLILIAGEKGTAERASCIAVRTRQQYLVPRLCYTENLHFPI